MYVYVCVHGFAFTCVCACMHELPQATRRRGWQSNQGSWKI